MKTPGNQKGFYVLIFAFSITKILLHLYTNAFASYGLFRDEYYYLACADHLDIGYVDQPPLSIWILAAIKVIFGKSLFAIRFFPAVFAGISVFFGGLIVKELGGGKKAAAIVCLSMIMSGINLSFATYYSMNVIDLLLWILAIYILVRLMKTERRRYWIFLGFILGLALLNKIGALFLGAGIFVALIFTRQRKWFGTQWPYVTAVISFLFFLPYVYWNYQHDWAHLEFIHNASTFKYSSLSAADFWKGQLLINNPVTIPVWICGIIFFFIRKQSKIYNFLFIVFSVVAVIHTMNGTSKPEYLAAIFPVLFIGGGLLLEWWGIKRKWLTYGIFVLLIAGAFLIPVAMPILPVEQYIKYSAVIGIKPESSENKELSELPQFYADMFGWKEKALAVSKAYQQIDPELKPHTVVYGDNYGRSASIMYYSDKYELPHSIGGHNNFWIWGPGDEDIEVVLILSDEVGDKTDIFEKVEDLGVVSCKYCMPYENNLHLYKCTGMKQKMENLWSQLKHYD